jgi:hypothetical protein
MGGGDVYWFASALAAAGGGTSAGELTMLGERFTGWHEPIPALLAAIRPRRCCATTSGSCAPRRGGWPPGRSRCSATPATR